MSENNFGFVSENEFDIKLNEREIG